MWKKIIFSDNFITNYADGENMKKVTIGLGMAAVLGLILVFYVFEQETASAGRYRVVYYKHLCDVEPESFPQDLDSLKRLSGLIRITWRERISPDMLQEYCYLPGRGVEKGRTIRTK